MARTRCCSNSPVEPFTPLVLGLLVFALALESFTFVVALREIGGWKGLAENRTNTTVLAVVLEDAVALLGILLTLLVAGVSVVLGPRPVFDAVVAITVGVLLGAMALFLAAINRRLLIDASDPALDRLVAAFLAGSRRVGRCAARSWSMTATASCSFTSGPATRDMSGGFDSRAIGEGLAAPRPRARGARPIDEVYWKRLVTQLVRIRTTAACPSTCSPT